MNRCRIIINGKAAEAQAGEVLLDAALRRGIEMPHDCRSGLCGTCRVRVTRGFALGGETPEPGTILACQAFVVSDIAVTSGGAQRMSALTGRVRELRPLAQDVMEVAIDVAEPPRHKPGQYYQIAFQGFPARNYSPTMAIGPLDPPEANRLRFHIKQFARGKVSSQLGRTIGVGHQARLLGPFGHAYLDEGRHGRLVLVAGGTGFAPIWAIADAAIRENFRRKVVMRVGARDYGKLYMRDLMVALHESSPIDVQATTGNHHAIVDILPPLTQADTVHVAGASQLVDRVTEIGAAAGATVRADAFLPSQAATAPTLKDMVRKAGQMLRRADAQAVRTS